MRHWSRSVAAGLALAACGCSSKAKDAQEQYGIVSRNGTLLEKCSKAQQVRDAYLAAGDSRNYKGWSAQAKSDCDDAANLGLSEPANDADRANSLNQMADQAAADANAALKEAQHTRK